MLHHFQREQLKSSLTTHKIIKQFYIVWAFSVLCHGNNPTLDYKIKKFPFQWPTRQTLNFVCSIFIYAHHVSHPNSRFSHFLFGSSTVELLIPVQEFIWAKLIIAVDHGLSLVPCNDYVTRSGKLNFLDKTVDQFFYYWTRIWKSKEFWMALNLHCSVFTSLGNILEDFSLFWNCFVFGPFSGYLQLYITQIITFFGGSSVYAKMNLTYDSTLQSFKASEGND